MTNDKSSKQSKNYEKDRRDRLNAAFDKLSTLLPDYDPVNSLSKIDILTKAFDHIQKLEAVKSKPSEFISESCEKENASLKAKVKHLSSRIRQLMDIMYSAKIEVPENLPPTSNYTPVKHCKWNGKAGNKKVQLLLKSVCDKNKENKKSKQKCNKTGKNKQSVSQAVSHKRTSKLYQQKKRIIRLVGNDDKLTPLSSISNVVLSIADINATVTVTPPKTVPIPSNVVPLQESNLKNKIISTPQGLTEVKNTVMPNSKVVSLISAPIMATGMASTLPVQNIVQNVNLGTYILPNGQIMAVQQPTPILPQITPQFLINRAMTPVIVMQNNNNIQNKPSIIIRNSVTNDQIKNNCRPIFPKRKYDSTKTTFSNHKPIPSLNLKFSSTKCSKQVKNDLINLRMRNFNSKKENSKASKQKKVMKSKSNLKKKNSRIDKKVNYKTSQDFKINQFKIKSSEKTNFNRNKFQNRIKCKSVKNVANKCANHGKVTNGSVLKRCSTLNSCDYIRSKKANLGSLNRLDEASVSRNDGTSCKNKVVRIADFVPESTANFVTLNNNSNFTSPSKSSNSEASNQKNIVLNDTSFNKNIRNCLEDKLDCGEVEKDDTNISEPSVISQTASLAVQNTVSSCHLDVKLVDSFNFNSSKDVLSQLSNYEKNSFLPILPSYLEDVREFPPDILSSFQIPSNLHNSESISPTAAFLLSFPLVSTSKSSELLNESELTCDNQNDNATSILQIGNLESPSSSIIEGQNILFDPQYTQLSKTHWLPKSCEKLETSQKFNDSLGLNFENHNADLLATPNPQDKRCTELNFATSKASTFKNKSSSTSNSAPILSKDVSQSVNKIASEKMPKLSPSAGISSSSAVISFSSSSAVPMSVSTKEVSRGTTTVTSNCLPIFSEVYNSKTGEKSSIEEHSQKYNGKNDENLKKLKEKPKSKALPINQEVSNASTNNKEFVAIKNENKNCREKVNAVGSDCNSNVSKSLVNWMTTPDVRSHVIEQFTIPEIFTSQSFDFLSSSSAPTNSYSVSFSSTNIDQLFEYSSALDNKQSCNASYPSALNQPNVWSPSKNSLPQHSIASHLDSNNFIIPSTLPTLIGDLALGTSTPMVDSYKIGPFELSDNYMCQKTGESLINENPKSNDRATVDSKNMISIESSNKCAAKGTTEEVFYPNKKHVLDLPKARQHNKTVSSKKLEFNDKSQQTSATNFLSVSQLVDQNQAKSNEVSNENQFTFNNKRHVPNRLKQVNKNSCRVFNNVYDSNGDKLAANKNRQPKKEPSAVNHSSEEKSDACSSQVSNSQISIRSRIDTDIGNNWYTTQNLKDGANFDTTQKSNNYSAESLLNNDSCQSHIMNCSVVSDMAPKSVNSCSMEKSDKLHPSNTSNNYYIPSPHVHYNNYQQTNNLIPSNNTFGESVQHSNQNYQSEISVGCEKSASGYYSFVPSSHACQISNKTSSYPKVECNSNVYTSAVSLSSVSQKSLKEKRTSCKHAAVQKNQPSNVELDHGVNTYVGPPLSRAVTISTLPSSSYIFTDPINTNTQSSLHANKIDNSTSQPSNENFLRPCVSISDYAPFDDCNFKTPQSSIPIPNNLISCSSSPGNSLYLPHTSLSCNTLSSNLNNKSTSYSNFLTPVVPTCSSSMSSGPLSTYAPPVITTSATLSSSASISCPNYMPSVISTSAVSISTSSSVSNYLPSLIGTSSLITTSNNYSSYLPPVISTSKSSKKAASSHSVPKCASSSSIANFLPPIISTPCISGGSNKISSYLPPVISTASLVFSQSNSISNYLPSIITTSISSSTCETSLSNYIPPAISTSNTLSSNDLSNYLPPVIPNLNEPSLYLPLSNVNNNASGSTISTQYLQTPSINYSASTPNTNLQFSSSTYLPFSATPSTNRTNVSSSQSKHTLSNAGCNTSSNQPHSTNSSISNAANNSSNYLPVFSNKTNNYSVSSTYVPVFSSSASLSTASSNYLPIFSNSSSDLPIVSSNYLPLSNCNQVQNSYPAINNPYSSNYLPTSNVASSNYFSSTSNSTVSNNLQFLNSTPNFTTNSASFSIANTVCSSANAQSSNYFMLPAVTAKPSSKTCKPSTNLSKSCNTSAKSTSSGSEISVDLKKLSASGNKQHDNEVNSKSSVNLNITAANGNQMKSCNPCLPNKFSNSSNSFIKLSKAATHEPSISNLMKQSAQFEVPKLTMYQQNVSSSYTVEQNHVPFDNMPKVLEKTKAASAVSAINSSSSINSFNCIYSSTDNVSYQPISIPNSFPNRPEFMDTASIYPLPSYNNDGSTYSVKGAPAGQRFVPPNEQIAYSSVAVPGTTSLTNFNLSAILPEMNEKIRCQNSANPPLNTQGVSEQISFSKYDFYQFTEKKVPHQSSNVKKEQQLQHTSQNIPLNQSNLNSSKSSSSVMYPNNVDAS